MLCGSAFKNKGVQPLLDAVVDYLPSPLDAKPIIGKDPRRRAEIVRQPSDNEPFAALAFKIATDPYGNLTYFRVYSGVLEKGTLRLQRAQRASKERIGRILRMHANHREDIDAIGAGDIAAAVGLSDTRTGDTLCDEKHPILLESITFPEPVISQAIEPKTKGDQDKMGDALARLAQEDPTFRMRTDEETEQTIIARDGRAPPRDHPGPLEARVQGRGERRQAAGRLQGERSPRRSRSRASSSGRPAARASTATSGCAWSRASRAPATSSRMGHRRRRRSRKEFMKPVDEGHPRGRWQSGVLAGYPVLDFKATVFDGSFHDVDSSEMAFKIAGSMAFKEAQPRGGPDPARADHGRRGHRPERVHRRRQRRPQPPPRHDPVAGRGVGGALVIKANVPLSEMFGYATDLRQRDPGPRDLHHGVLALREGAEDRRSRDRSQSSGKKLATA